MAGNEQDIRATLINSQEEEQEKNSALDALIDLLPFEMHVKKDKKKKKKEQRPKDKKKIDKIISNNE